MTNKYCNSALTRFTLTTFIKKISMQERVRMITWSNYHIYIAVVIFTGNPRLDGFRV